MAGATVFNGRDNHISVQLKANNVIVQDHTIFTKIRFSAGAVSINSIDNADLFEITSELITIKAGLAGIAAGRYDAVISAWDASNTDGIVYTDSLIVIVKDVPA